MINGNTNSLAIVFWNGHGWIWVDRANHSVGDTEPVTLDAAIRSAHARGYDIHEVNRTAGAIKLPRSPLIIPNDTRK